VLYKFNGPSGSHTPNNGTRSTQTIQQKIQKIIQESVQKDQTKQSERTSTAASMHHGLGNRLNDPQATNQTLLKLL